MPENLIIEGLSPILADLDGDEVREIIVTVSNTLLVARILVYNEDGHTSHAIGIRNLDLAPTGDFDGE